MRARERERERGERMCNVCPAKYWLCVERAQRVSCRKFFYEFLGERLCVLLEKVIHAAALDASLIPLPCKSKLAFNFCSRRKKLDLVIDLITCDSFIFDTLHRLLIWYPMYRTAEIRALVGFVLHFHRVFENDSDTFRFEYVEFVTSLHCYYFLFVTCCKVCIEKCIKYVIDYIDCEI